MHLPFLQGKTSRHGLPLEVLSLSSRTKCTYFPSYLLLIPQIRIVEYNEEGKAYHSTAEIETQYPQTKVLFLPDTAGTHPDLVGIDFSCV
jgi:hypothetical protein